MEKKYPKVLVLGSTFNDYTAGGITLANMFKYWPKECIANASSDIDIEACERVRPCISYYHFNDSNIKNKAKKASISKQGRKSAITNIKKQTIAFLAKMYLRIGYKDLISDNRLTPEFQKFVKEFNPDIIFDPIGSLRELKFIEKIHSKFKTPIAIHVWDDWPEHPGANERFFNSIWKKTYRKAFKRLLKITAYRFSICEKMSVEYKKRYNEEFYPIHNPVNILIWDAVPNKEFDSKNVSILYFGKISKATHSAIIEMCKAVDFLNENGKSINFDIYSHHCTEDVRRKVEKHKGCNIYPSNLSKEEVIKKMKEASILFLPLSFDKKSAEYSRLSMLTKISEYLVSKTPILLYCPQDAAVSEYLRQHNAAFDSERGTDNIVETLKEIIENNEKRELITQNAYNLAYEKHRIEDVCERFRASFFSNK